MKSAKEKSPKEVVQNMEDMVKKEMQDLGISALTGLLWQQEMLHHFQKLQSSWFSTPILQQMFQQEMKETLSLLNQLILKMTPWNRLWETLQWKRHGILLEPQCMVGSPLSDYGTLTVSAEINILATEKLTELDFSKIHKLEWSRHQTQAWSDVFRLDWTKVPTPCPCQLNPSFESKDWKHAWLSTDSIVSSPFTKDVSISARASSDWTDSLCQFSAESENKKDKEEDSFYPPKKRKCRIVRPRLPTRTLMTRGFIQTCSIPLRLYFKYSKTCPVPGTKGFLLWPSSSSAIHTEPFFGFEVIQPNQLLLSELLPVSESDSSNYKLPTQIVTWSRLEMDKVHVFSS